MPSLVGVVAFPLDSALLDRPAWARWDREVAVLECADDPAGHPLWLLGRDFHPSKAGNISLRRSDGDGLQVGRQLQRRELILDGV